MPLSTMENDYHNPYDHDVGGGGGGGGGGSGESDHLNHYEPAPTSMLARTRSGSLYIPSDIGNTTLDSRLRGPSAYDSYSPHHNSTLAAAGHHMGTAASSKLLNSSAGSPSSRSPATTNSGGGDYAKHSDSTLPSGFQPAMASHQPLISTGTAGSRGAGVGGGYGHHGGGGGQMHGVHNQSTIGRRMSPNSSSHYSNQNWHEKKELSGRCSWKFVAIVFILLSIIFLSALTYLAAANLLNSSYDDTAKACAIVETASNEISVIDNEENHAFISSSVDRSEYGAPGVVPAYPTSRVSSGASLPPDGTTFRHLGLGEKQTRLIPAYSFWNFQFHQPESAYVEFDFLIARGASIGVYGRKNAVPTLTQNDLREVLAGVRTRNGRDANDISGNQLSVAKTASYFLPAGHWFLSLYNDDGDANEVSFVARVAPELTRNCPKGCSGRGECVLGKCQCHAGFDGPDCGQSICPVLCSGNGDYEDGACRCYPGWKGGECQLRHDECVVADCGGHGKCVDGGCACARGFTGEACQETDCPDPTCSGHGFCVAGSCVCRKGWRGLNCGQLDREARQCLPDCSGHGEFDLELQQCVCRGQWTGNDCSKERCGLDCGPHGTCESGHCVCSEGWEGDRCGVRLCDARCKDHGVCSDGTCLCTNGWNGKHCTLSGCPGNCNGHGQCKTNHYMEWECWCDSGWFGEGCDVYMEKDCSDRKDNDDDGLTDCEDPECCENPVCSKSQLCHTVRPPIDILLRKQPPAATASFFERMKFIIEDQGLQSYVQRKGFNESRAAVVRGQVVTPSGMGLIGVRVSTTLPNEGFTMTRDDGWFDLMVNGGGSVMLQFGRSPYPPMSLNIYVPWNEVVVLDPVVMSRSLLESGFIGNSHASSSETSCDDHDFDLMKPLVLATWNHGFQGQISDRPAILMESQAVQESLPLPGTNLHLVYHSARTKGYLSIIQLQLTPEVIPSSLTRVHVKITIEGVVHDKLFEADPNIQYTYAWDRLNEYRQRVYGITTATVKVGYEYSGCSSVMWNIQTTKVSGHDMASEDIGGGWQLDAQHKYNFHAGILQKGDGHTVYLKYKPHVVTTVMGDGEQRPIDCPATADGCDGPALGQRLLAPKAVAAAPDGSVYVADYNLLRRITPDGHVTSLLRLNSSRVSYRYHLAHCTYNHELEQKQTLYISQPEAHQVIRLKKLPNLPLGPGDPPAKVPRSELDTNWDTFIGTGARCLPGDADRCGDGGKAANARLAYPKGMAVAPDGKTFLADGSNIRMVDEHGVITTVIGHQYHRSTWRPMPCSGAMPARDVQLNWPTELAVSPLDNTLHFIDDNVVLKMTHDGRVSIVAGRPLHCPPPNKLADSALATAASLVEPQSLSFAPNGDLFVVESDSQRINRIRRISTDGRIATYAGSDSKCNCLDVGCPCFEPDRHLAANTPFSSIASVACSPDGVLYVADTGNYRIRAVGSNIPPEKSDGVFEVPDPDAQELYIFNKFGQHVLTKDIMTSSVVYRMSYTQATSNGRLDSVTDAAGRKLTIMRDLRGQVEALRASSGEKYTIKMSRVGDLETFREDSTGQTTEFKYLHSTRLLRSKLDLGRDAATFYDYDDNGRLVGVVAPTGERTDLKFNLTSSGAAIEVTKGESTVRVLQLKEDRIASAEGVVSIMADKSLKGETSWGKTVEMMTISHPVIASISDAVAGDSFPMVGEQRTSYGSNLVNELTWKYTLARNGHNGAMMGMKKTVNVNGEDLLTVHFDKLQKRQVFYKGTKAELLELRHDSLSRPILFDPKTGEFEAVRQDYDRFGHLSKWEWGTVSETYDYDKSGRLSTVRRSNITLFRYGYPDGDRITSLPTSVIIGDGGKFELKYDEKSGGLAQIQTPRGHLHMFRTRPAVASMRLQYRAPWSVGDSFYETLVNAHGDVVRKRMPGSGNEGVSFIRDEAGRVRQQICGDFEADYSYDPSAGTLDAVVVQSGHGLDLKIRNKYHSGLLKERRLRFVGDDPELDNALFRYQYDGHGRPSSMVVGIGSGKEQTWTSAYDANTGLVEGLGDLRVSRVNGKVTTLQDINGNYFKTTELDGNGRPKRIAFGLRRKEMLSYEFGYDSQGRLARRKTTNQSGRQVNELYSYTADGHLARVRGSSEESQFRYDSNGNLVGMGAVNLEYDVGDRVQRVGGGTQVHYDASGNVRKVGEKERLWLDARGKLREFTIAGENTRVSFHYDHLGRLVAWHDSNGRALQYFYANPAHDMEVTHVHDPKAGLTQRLLYDDKGFLVAIETSGGQRLLVATDQVGSPVLVFRQDGSVLKELEYSAFGRIMLDGNPSLSIPVGFHGGLVLPHSSMLYMPRSGRVYHPRIVQYLNPDWESLNGPNMENPLDLFVYRFRNNDPVNRDLKPAYMTDVEDWLRLYGIDMDKILDAGRRDLAQINESPVQRYGGLEMVSGLENTLRSAERGISRVGFVRPLCDFRRRLVLNTRISSRPIAFGAGFVLTVAQDSGTSTVNVAEGVSPGVVQKIFESVLNGSRYLDVSFHQSGGKSVYYFAKPSVSKFRIDMDAVNRLAGAFDVGVRELDKGSKDLKIENAAVVVHVIYGGSADHHRDSIQSEQIAQASNMAWAREKTLVSAGFRGQGDWTNSQRAELASSSRGKVKGFTAAEIHGRNRYPHLARDASNFLFTENSNSGSHRRKGRHGKTRPSRH